MNSLQFFDDPDDVPSINENITIHVGVNGNDLSTNGSEQAPFRTLGKAIDAIRNKIIEKNKKVTIQLGAASTSRTGGDRKYFEEEEITIDFESAKRLKIKGVTPTNHEVVGISYYDKCSDREGFYCQIVVTNQDKIAIGDYIGIYDHFKIKKKNPSYYWVRDNVGSKMQRLVTPGNCYAEAIRGDMILGVHEVVDVGQPIGHTGDVGAVSTELFLAEEVQVGTVTVHIKNDNYTYGSLNEVPYYNTLGTLGGKPLWTYAAGSPTSPLKNTGTRYLPMVFYGADDNSLFQPDSIDSENRENFYFTSAVSQIEITDIMTRGFGFDLSPLNGKIVDPRTLQPARDANILWNDRTLTGYNRSIVAAPIATYFYKKMADDLRITDDLPYYFGKTNNPFVTIESIVSAAKKIRDYLLSGAKRLNSVPPWDEDNHPGYGFGPFESGAVRNPIGGGTEIDKTSYPSEYADRTKESILLRFYNIYPPVNGQMYTPTLLRRIETFYNAYGENAGGRLQGTSVGLKLEQWSAVGNKSPFFCGYITPQGWVKQQYISTPTGGQGEPLPSLDRTEVNGGYHALFGTDYPIYAANDSTSFNAVAHGTVGALSNDRLATSSLYYVDRDTYLYETLGITTATGGSGVTTAEKGSMGTQWYSGSPNFFQTRTDVGPGVYGHGVFDRYSFGYRGDDNATGLNDGVRTTSDPVVQDESINPQYLYGTQSMNLRAKCFKSVLRFNGTGIKVKSKTKLALLKDLCLVNINTRRNRRNYGLVADEESTINASNIGVSSFSCGISARNQSLVNLLADLGNSTNPNHKGMMEPVDPAAVLTANDIGVESSLKSHINAQRTVSTGSRLANYLSIANSSIDCSNSASVCGFKHGFVTDFNSYMKATNCFSEFNAGVGFSTANNSILVAHRSRSIWNGNHGLLARAKANARCYEFISRSNGGDGILAQAKSVISCGANSPNFANYRESLIDSDFRLYGTDDYLGIYAMLIPHLFIVNTVYSYDPADGNPLETPVPARTINNNPSHGAFVIYHECNNTICEFNCGSGIASETDSMVIADNTISRYNSKKYGEFAVYGWSGLRSSYITDSFIPTEKGA